MPGIRGPAPEDRHFAHYIEQHASDSVDEAVARAERWAKDLEQRGARTDAGAFPDAGWFAGQVLRELRAVRYYLALSEGEAHKAVWYALRLGELIAEARLRDHLNGPKGDRTNGPMSAPPPRPIPPGPPDEPGAESSADAP